MKKKQTRREGKKNNESLNKEKKKTAEKERENINETQRGESISI